MTQAETKHSCLILRAGSTALHSILQGCRGFDNAASSGGLRLRVATTAVLLPCLPWGGQGLFGSLHNLVLAGGMQGGGRFCLPGNDFKAVLQENTPSKKPFLLFLRGGGPMGFVLRHPCRRAVQGRAFMGQRQAASFDFSST